MSGVSGIATAAVGLSSEIGNGKSPEKSSAEKPVRTRSSTLTNSLSALPGEKVAACSSLPRKGAVPAATELLHHISGYTVHSEVQCSRQVTALKIIISQFH